MSPRHSNGCSVVVWNRVRQINADVIAYIRKYISSNPKLVEEQFGLLRSVASLVSSCSSRAIENSLMTTPSSWFSMKYSASAAIDSRRGGDESQRSDAFLLQAENQTTDDLTAKIELRQLNLLVLHAVRDIALSDPAVASQQFGINEQTLQNLVQLSIRDLFEVANQTGICVHLKHGSSYEYWQPLLTLTDELQMAENWQSVVRLRALQSSVWAPSMPIGVAL